MKQRITEDQLNELTEKQQIKLHDWFYKNDWLNNPEYLHEYNYHTVDIGEQNNEISLPLLSFGQIIELLWNLITNEEFNELLKDIKYLKFELIDMCWVVVKAKL